MQELERQRQSLGALRVQSGDLGGRRSTRSSCDIDRAAQALHQSSGKTGQELRENEWLMGIKQRAAIPGGVCQFDLPSYHYWLHQPAQTRRRDLEGWLTPFLPLKHGIAIILRILRESGRTSQQLAAQGVYQQMMGGRLAQLLRLQRGRQLRMRPRGQRQQVRAEHPLHGQWGRPAPAREPDRHPLRAELLQPVSGAASNAGELPALRQGLTLEHGQPAPPVLLRALQADRSGPVGLRVLPHSLPDESASPTRPEAEES